MNARIFVSYRRNDNSWAAQRIFEDLSKKYFALVFKDHSIEGGQDFKNRLETEISSCNILIAIIGNHWVKEMEVKKVKGQVDYVVEEIVHALREGKKIIPVLLDDTKMIDDYVLPVEIKQFSTVHAERITLELYEKGISRLISIIDKFLLEKQKAKKVLVIDGLSVRGLVSLNILKTLERHLNIYSAKENGRLCDHFDLIISTGPMSTIAALLAMGKSVKEATSFYELGQDFFLTTAPGSKSSLLNSFNSYGLNSKFQKFVQDTFGKTGLVSMDFKTGFCLFLFNVETRRTESFSTFESLVKENSKLLVTDLMLAACSIPYVNCTNPFCIIRDNKEYHYYSGLIGTTNIPSLRSLQFLIDKEEKLKWQIDEDSLCIVSVGTGFFADKMPVKEKLRLMKLASRLPEMIMQSASDTNNYIIDAITRSVNKAKSIGDPEEVLGITLAREKKFGTYFRIDINLTDVDKKLTYKSGFMELKRSLENKDDLITTDYLKPWFETHSSVISS